MLEVRHRTSAKIAWWSRLPGDVIDQCRLQEKIRPVKEILADEVLIGTNGNALVHAQRTQDIEDFRIATISIQEADN